MIPAKYQTLKITSNTQSLRLVERLIEDVCQIYSVNEDCYGNMLIAVTEAVNNAILHGNKGNPEKFVKIGFESDDNTLVFSVADEGPGFDYQSLPDPTDLPRAADRRRGGISDTHLRGHQHQHQRPGGDQSAARPANPDTRRLPRTLL